MRINYNQITSKNNPLIKWAASLKEKKYRESEGCFLAEGEKLTKEALESGLDITHIFISESKSEYFLNLICGFLEKKEHAECRVSVIPEWLLEKISTENSPQGIISVIKHLDFFRRMDIIYKEEFLKNPSERVMILSSLRDPGNLGSVVRSAVAFGVCHLIMSDDCADIYNSKTVRGAMGSLFKVKVSIVSDLVSTVKEIRAAGRRVLSAELDENAKRLGADKILRDDVIIIGNEGHGVSSEVSSAATDKIYIPISAKTESLNASVSAAIFMWELSKVCL